MSMMNKMKKSSTIGLSETLVNSEVLNMEKHQTESYAINIAMGGSPLRGGFTKAVSVIGAPSAHLKTIVGLLTIKAYLDKYDDSCCVFYDTEMGASLEYFESIGIDPTRVLHCPVDTIENMKFDMTAQLDNIERGDRVIFFIDSIGNIASNKERDDALDQKAVADMTKAKAIKSFFRMVTATLNIKDIPCIIINHVYANIGSFTGGVVQSGGCLDGTTKIRMGDNTTKEIKDVEIGDVVVTMFGNKEVTYKFNPSELGTKDTLVLTMENGEDIVCTENHKFLVNVDDELIWKCAKDLSINDNLATI